MMGAPSHVRSGDLSLDVLAQFAEPPAEVLARRSLQQRVDRKFLLPAHSLGQLLTSCHHDYFVVRSGGKTLARYESLYFDTPDRQLYEDHRRGRRPRHKVRIRHHLDRQLTFLEVKQKETGGRTTKVRLALPFMQTWLGAAECHFIEAHAALDASRLVPCIAIAFLRTTLVGASVDERLTLDCDLRFASEQRCERLSGVVIAEIKQPRHANGKGAVTMLRALQAREEALSKYCLATVLTVPVRANVFKPALRALRRVSA